MKAWIDIENAHTQKVITLEVPLLEFDDLNKVVFDISNITQDELEKLKVAINPRKDLMYTDIEMFFTDQDNYPNFGPDYDFTIKDNQLIGIYTRDKWLNKMKGDDKHVKK